MYYREARKFYKTAWFIFGRFAAKLDAFRLFCRGRGGQNAGAA
jgi:hypothetical protein